MRVEKGSVCVYRHIANDRVFYVGKGTAERPFLATGRNARWSAVVKRAGGCYDVEIAGWYRSDAEARAAETAEIERLLPEANIRFSDEKGNGVKRRDPAADKIAAALAAEPKTIDQLCSEVFGDYSPRTRNTVRVNLTRIAARGSLIRLPTRYALDITPE